MQTKERLPATGVIGHLFDNPAQYQFRQALRILLLWLRSEGVRYDDAFRNVLRFQNSVSLGFPASEIETLRVELAGALALEDGEASSATPEHIVLTPALIGLLGANGSLPFHYTERIARHELHTKDDAARAFLDILSNRMVGLFFETWGKYRLEARIDTHGIDPLRGMLTQLGGFHGIDGEDDVQACFAAAFSTRPVAATTVADLLSHHFGVPVELEQFVGSWDLLAATQQTLIGRPGAALGHGATLGKRIWRCDLRIRLNIGPLDAAQRDRCLPNGAIAKGIRRMLQRFGMSNLDCEVCLLLKPECVDPAKLTANTQAPDRLGWGSFLASTHGAPKDAAVRYLFEMRSKRPVSAW